ncbi:hypothetical protein QA802_30755 [Streptomyces sp. B21-105]|uniref:hypothetical protein n=1 Tax=Streptomyces sp. B21-105 TaxID=3039417 RepID=UPI002FF09FDE
MTTAYEPGRLCPVDPGLLVLIAAAVLGIALFAAAAVLLLAVIDAAARRIRRRLTRTRRARDHYAAAIARARHGHTRTPEGRCADCHVTWPCPLLCRLAGPPCSPDCDDRHAPIPDPAPPRPHLDVMAAAVEDWWLTTDPLEDRATGPHLAAHVEMYLHSSGYHITPNP